AGCGACQNRRGARSTSHTVHLVSEASLPSLGFHAQITHESVKAVLVAVVLFPAGKVSDVASPRGSAAQPPWQYWNGRSRTGFSREDHVCLRQSVCRPDMATCSWQS